MSERIIACPKCRGVRGFICGSGVEPDYCRTCDGTGKVTITSGVSDRGAGAP